MKCQRLFEKIDELYEEYLSVWEEVANIESPSSFKEGVDKAGEYFANLAREKGWTVEKLSMPESGDALCITMNPHSNEKPLSLCGHIDTVHPLGSFGTPAVRRDDKNIYGPGVMDCKGGIVAAFLAMDALNRCNFTSRPIQLLLDPDEETNSMLSKKETINYICKKAENSIALLNCESSIKGTAVLERKGTIRYDFNIYGKQIHSSKCARGASAIAEAAHKILLLEKFKDENGITCNCGVIQGGSAPNSVPESCMFITDIRFSTADELEQVRKFIKETSETSHIEGCSCVVRETGFRPAMEYKEENVKLLERMNEIFKENSLPALTARKSLGGSDASDASYRGIPCVDSIAVEGDYIHTTKEYAILESLRESAKRIGAVAYCI